MGLLAGRCERVVVGSRHAEFALRDGIVRPQVLIVDRPVGPDAPDAGRIEVSLVEPHHHPLPVERRAADTSRASVVQRVEPLPRRLVSVALWVAVPDIRPIVGGADRPLLSGEPVGRVEPRSSLENYDLVAGLSEAISDEPAGWS